MPYDSVQLVPDSSEPTRELLGIGTRRAQLNRDWNGHLHLMRWQILTDHAGSVRSGAWNPRQLLLEGPVIESGSVFRRYTEPLYRSRLR
jgi:hypothetical protein